MAVTKEEFLGGWIASAPKFTLTQPEVADWSEDMQVPAVPYSSSLLMADVLSLPLRLVLQLSLLRPLNGLEQLLSALTLFFLKLLNRKG